MSLHLTIPDPLAAKVAAAAESQGKRPEDLVIEAIETKLNPLARLDELMAAMRPRWCQVRVRQFTKQLPSPVENRVLSQRRSLIRLSLERSCHG